MVAFAIEAGEAFAHPCFDKEVLDGLFPHIDIVRYRGIEHDTVSKRKLAICSYYVLQF